MCENMMMYIRSGLAGDCRNNLIGPNTVNELIFDKFKFVNFYLLIFDKFKFVNFYLLIFDKFKFEFFFIFKFKFKFKFGEGFITWTR